MSEPHSLAERIDQRMRAGKVTLPVFDTAARSTCTAPYSNRLYDRPCSRAAAFRRWIQRARYWRFFRRRPMYAYWPALMTACFATRNTLRRAL